MVTNSGAGGQFGIGSGDCRRAVAGGRGFRRAPWRPLGGGASGFGLRPAQQPWCGAARRRVFAIAQQASAMGALTFTPSVPSGTRILPMRPSSTASNSIVALSVSISARMSPDLTVSPSFTSHLASLPSSMVGDSAGIRICVDIRRAHPCRVRPARARGFRWRIRRRRSTMARISLSIAFRSSSLTMPRCDQLLAEMVDGIALLAHLAALPRGCGIWPGSDMEWPR